MINGAIFWKTMRDSAATLIAAAIGMTAFVVLFVWSMQSMGTELLDFVSKFGFLKKIFEVGFGINVSGEISLNVLFSACFTHAMILLLAWSTIISISTRVTVGEVERGTADLLLSLPVSRQEVMFSTSLVWVLSAAVLSACPIVGVWIGSLVLETEEVVEINRYVAPAVNFFCLNLAVGGISTMIACLASRRGLAIAWIVGVLVSSVVLNFVEPFIDAVKHIRIVGLMSYFRPVDTVRNNDWPVSSILVLLGIAVVSWVVGSVVFCRKDIPSA